jgi:hypothetical protein
VALPSGNTRLSRFAPLLASAALLAGVFPDVSAEEEGVREAIPGWITGSLRGSWWSGSRTLDDEDSLPGAALWLKAEPRLGESIGALVEGWTRDDDLPESGRRKSKVREAYASASADAVDIRLGRQIIVWGRADQINPTDNLTPRDFTLLVPETGDDRLGTLAALGAYQRDEYSLSAIWLPRFRPNVVPAPLPPGVSLREEIPDDATQFAVKLERSGAGGADWSLSWFSGFDLNPTLGTDPQATAAGLVARHPRIRVAGADFAIPIGRFGLRGEAAYTWTEDRDGADPLEKNPFFFGVFGVERTFLAYLNINVQYYVYSVRHYQDPRSLTDPQIRQLAVSQAILNHQLDRREHGVAFRVANKWWNETLEAEAAVLASFEGKDYAIKPKLIYAFNDGLTGTLGADLLHGSEDALFGRLRKNSLVYGELRYSW